MKRHRVCKADDKNFGLKTDEGSTYAYKYRVQNGKINYENALHLKYLMYYKTKQKRFQNYLQLRECFRSPPSWIKKSGKFPFLPKWYTSQPEELAEMGKVE